jgi:hypothetical protein
MAYLFLNLKGEYFDAIKSGEKTVEYRLYNKYWKRRLLDGPTFKKWDKIVIRRGYPRSDDHTRQIIRAWRGAWIETITHPHFGDKPVKVFAIPVAFPAYI